MGEVMHMRMAKASDKEIEQAIILAGVLDDVDRDQYPRGVDGEFNENDPDYFDEDDREHLKVFLDRMKELSGGLFRVVFGFATLMNPANELVDPDLDHLALHPRLIKALQAVDGEDPARCEICGARMDSHDADHLCRMHREFGEDCQVCGSNAAALSMEQDIAIMMPGLCVWSKNPRDPDLMDTGCEELHLINVSNDKDYSFCPYCGEKMEIRG